MAKRKTTADKAAGAPKTTKTPKAASPKSGTVTKSAASKKATTKSASATTALQVSPEMRMKMIAEAAYYHAINNGNGANEVENWLRAEKEIDRQIKVAQPRQ